MLAVIRTFLLSTIIVAGCFYDAFIMPQAGIAVHGNMIISGIIVRGKIGGYYVADK